MKRQYSVSGITQIEHTASEPRKLVTFVILDKRCFNYIILIDVKANLARIFLVLFLTMVMNFKGKLIVFYVRYYIR